MAFSFRIPEDDETAEQLVNMTDIFNNLDCHPSDVAGDVVHPFSHSELLGPIFQIIYTKQDIENFNINFLQYTEDMTEKHGSMGVIIEPEEIELCWRILVKREFPRGNPTRQMLLKHALIGQTGHHNIIDFWEVRAKHEHKEELHQLREEVEDLARKLGVLVKTDGASIQSDDSEEMSNYAGLPTNENPPGVIEAEPVPIGSTKGGERKHDCSYRAPKADVQDERRDGRAAIKDFQRQQQLLKMSTAIYCQ